MLKNILEKQIGQTVPEKQFNLVLYCVDADIKFNNLHFEKATYMQYIKEKMLETYNILKRIPNEA